MTRIHTKILIFFTLVCVLVGTGCLSENIQENRTTTTTTPVPVVTFIRPTIQTQCPSVSPETDPCIVINPIGSHTVGDVFEINGTTNLGADSKIFLSIYEPELMSVPPGPGYTTTPNYQYSQTSGQVKIQSGTGGVYTWSYIPNISDFRAPKYYDVYVWDGSNNSIQAGSFIRINPSKTESSLGDEVR